MAKVIGKVSLRLNGKLFTSKPGATLSGGGVSRTPIPNDQGGIDYSESTMQSEIEATFVGTADTDFNALADFANGVLTFDTDAGKSFTITGACLQDPYKVTGGSGDVAVKFFGNKAKLLSI